MVRLLSGLVMFLNSDVEIILHLIPIAIEIVVKFQIPKFIYG